MPKKKEKMNDDEPCSHGKSLIRKELNMTFSKCQKNAIIHGVARAN